MRINKLLSNKGICSRRDTNRLIEAGRIRVNGKLAIGGQWVEETDEILLDDKPLMEREKVYLLLNKPVGVVCTADESVKANIIDYVNYPTYIFPVGRLDKASEGLILMTNDGELAHRISDSGHQHEKEYEVTVDRPFDAAFLEQMARGIQIDGKITRPCKTVGISEDTFRIILTQGLNRQIRKMCLALGYKVTRLERIRILFLEKKELAEGKWRLLTMCEIHQLKQWAFKETEEKLINSNEEKCLRGV